MVNRNGKRVGYKEPPDHTKYGPGQTGNPNGRPRQTMNLESDLRQELAQRISIREDGKTRRVSKQRAFVKALVQRAVSGDARAVNSLVALCGRMLLPTQDAVAPETSPQDQLLVDEYIRREAEALAASKANRKPRSAPK